MTAGLLLVICISLPAAAGMIVPAIGTNARLENVVSTTVSVLTLALALGVTAVLLAAPSTRLQFHVAIAAWKLSPDDPTPTVTLHLSRFLAFAPPLAAAFALLLVSASGPGRTWSVHLQHAAIQGSLSAATPESGLTMLTASTVVAAMTLSTVDDSAGRRGLAIALRWVSADVVLWIWTAGFFGTGTAAARIAAVALMVRASVFPFQGAMARVGGNPRSTSLFLVPFSAVVWSSRWMDRTTIPNTLTLQLVAASAVLIPAVLAMASNNRDVAASYRLTSLMIWPLVFPMTPDAAIGLVGLGIAAATCRSTWGSIARAASVVVPSLSVLSIAQGRHLTSVDLVGWAAVSLSAIVIHGGPVRRTSAEEMDVSAWREAVFAIVSLSAIVAPSFLVSVPKVDP